MTNNVDSNYKKNLNDTVWTYMSIGNRIKNSNKTNGQGITLCVAVLLFLGVFFVGCSNDPYRPGETAEQTFFSSFSTPPTKLDPSSAYYSHEGRIIDQIYEPLFSYHYLKRPYEIIPNTAVSLPAPVYYDKDGDVIKEKDPAPDLVAYAEYDVQLKKGILYQNHPCFAKDKDGNYIYADVTLKDIKMYDYPSDFEFQGTREVKAKDYALQMRRLADPRLSSPIFSIISQYIAGLAELNKEYIDMLAKEREQRRAKAGAAYNQERDEKANPIRLDYFKPKLKGVQVLGDYELKIVLKRKYPQIIYWMCMHFFAAVPQEAIDFYRQPAMAEKQFSLNRCPVGSGPYFLKKFKPNEIIILERNPNYHEDYYPEEGAVGDFEKGLLVDAGKRIPFINKQVYRMEKESIPAWNKFLQGYVDVSGIANDVFDQAIQISAGDGAILSSVMKDHGIRLITGAEPTLWYTGFNMLDKVVGGYSEKSQKLRQAISIVMDYNEFLDIFMNGRGILAQGPLPPGIFGYRPGDKGTNPFIDAWDVKSNRHIRQSVEKAKALMVEAGYPDGRDKDGKPLTLDYDHSSGMDPSFRSRFDWARSRLDLIGVRLNDKGTDLSRFRQKRKQGNWQFSSGGWLADYPDPENFLFLFYGPNGKVETGGPNMVNYANPEYDKLFKQMESMANGSKRQSIIDEMMLIVQKDAPAIWQFYPVAYVLCHKWYKNVKPHAMMYNTLKYHRVDADMRANSQEEWNKPIYWPIILLFGILLLGLLPIIIKSVDSRK